MLQKHIHVLLCVLSFTLVACTPTTYQVVLDIVPVIDGQRINCQNIPLHQSIWRIDQLAFFMSDVRLSSHGKTFSVESAPQAPINLVRLSTASCTARLDLSAERAPQQGDTLHFTLGVPFTLNHQNPVTQPSPLNEPDMFWTWRNGYKFLRLDMSTEQDDWAYHLGSVGCQSDSAVRSPTYHCAQPNLSHHQITVRQDAPFTLFLHLDALLDGVTLTHTNRCVMHGETEVSCAHLFGNLSNSAKPLFTMEIRP